MVPSYYPIVALLMCKGAGASACFALPEDTEEALAQLRSPSGRQRLAQRQGVVIGEVPWRRVDEQVHAIEKGGVRVVTFADEHYPPDLATIPEAPPILFYRGDISMLHKRGIAIVGTRNPTARGCGFARNLAAGLSRIGVTVTSGVARGIDAAAHTGALDRAGSTVGVLGTGLDVAFPPSNRGLIESIAARGCLVTEQLMGTPAQAFVFPRRNRLISGLSHAVVVVEAASRSGALITARWALEQGRDVGAVPGFPGEPRSRGANRLIKQGAFVVETVDDILEAVPLLGRALARAAGWPSLSMSAAPDDLPEEAQAVLQAVGADATDVDAIARHSGLGAALVQRVLLDLEIRGVVARDENGFYYSVRAGES